MENRDRDVDLNEFRIERDSIHSLFYFNSIQEATFLNYLQDQSIIFTKLEEMA